MLGIVRICLIDLEAEEVVGIIPMPHIIPATAVVAILDIVVIRHIVQVLHTPPQGLLPKRTKRTTWVIGLSNQVYMGMMCLN